MTVKYKFTQIRNKLFPVYRKGFLLGTAQKNAELDCNLISSTTSNTVEYYLVQVANNMMALYRSGYKKGLLASGAITTIRIDTGSHIQLPRPTVFSNFIEHDGRLLRASTQLSNLQLTPLLTKGSGAFLDIQLMIQHQFTPIALAMLAQQIQALLRGYSRALGHFKKSSGRLLTCSMRHAFILDANAYLEQLSASARVCRAYIAFKSSSNFAVNTYTCKGPTYTHVTIPQLRHAAPFMQCMQACATAQLMARQHIAAIFMQCTQAHTMAEIKFEHNVSMKYTHAAAKLTRLNTSLNDMDAKLDLVPMSGRYIRVSSNLAHFITQARINMRTAARLNDLTQFLQSYDNKTLYVVGTKILHEV